MERIDITKEEQTENGWRFVVEVGEGSGTTEHVVEVDKEYWEKLAQGKVEPVGLVRKSFEFLLARESKESILRQFNLRQISAYFPEYESEIKSQMP